MDAKITLSFDEEVIIKAKKYAENNNISLSRLTEFLLKKATSDKNFSMETYPISDWVSIVAEGNAIYETSSSKAKKINHKAEYFKSKK